jgi:Hsp70 protein
MQAQKIWRSRCVRAITPQARLDFELPPPAQNENSTSAPEVAMMIDGQPQVLPVFDGRDEIGRKFAIPDTQAELGLLPYQVTASGSGGLWVQAGGRSYTPTEITAMMLGEVRRATEAYLGTSVNQAVIAAPAYFDESQGRATIAAAKIAGIEVLDSD